MQSLRLSAEVLANLGRDLQAAVNTKVLNALGLTVNVSQKLPEDRLPEKPAANTPVKAPILGAAFAQPEPAPVRKKRGPGQAQLKHESFSESIANQAFVEGKFPTGYDGFVVVLMPEDRWVSDFPAFNRCKQPLKYMIFRIFPSGTYSEQTMHISRERAEKVLQMRQPGARVYNLHMLPPGPLQDSMQVLDNASNR